MAHAVVQLSRFPDNWGRWGREDEIGGLNFLDRTEVMRGVASVRAGKVFTLGYRLCRPDGDLRTPNRPSNSRFMLKDKGSFQSGKAAPFPNGSEDSDDAVLLYTHGTTHMDALGHMWRGDAIYNGRDPMTTVGGLEFASVTPLADRGVVGAAVLLDIARWRGVTHLEGEEALSLQDLLSTAAAQHVVLQKRTILLIRTGWLGHLDATGYRSHPTPMGEFREPGLAPSDELVHWFHEMEIPLLATDTLTNESIHGFDAPTALELHVRLMSNLGVVFVEVSQLDDLARDCADDGQYEFLYVAAPLKITGATGSPVNPIVVK